MNCGEVKLYTAARNGLPIGETITAWKTKKPMGGFKRLEAVIEKLRPSGYPSRLASFYMVDDPKLVNLMGPTSLDTAPIYEVEPVSLCVRTCSGWLEEVMNKPPTHPNVKDAIEKYWSGEMYHRFDGPYGFEYLAKTIFVKKELPALKTKKGRYR